MSKDRKIDKQKSRIKINGKWKHNPKYQKWYKKTHLETLKEYYRKYSRTRVLEAKSKIICLLGNKCVWCGYLGPSLQIDYIHNNGWIERRKKSSYSMYESILKKILNGSKDYQLLCANCNYLKEMKKRGTLDEFNRLLDKHEIDLMVMGRQD